MRMRKITGIALFAIFLPLFYGIPNAQSSTAPAVDWSKTYDAAGSPNTLQQTSDGGYIAGGWDGSILKTDSSGNLEWSKNLAGIFQVTSLLQVSGGGYIVVGSTASDISLIKTDSMGNREWTKAFGGSNNDEGQSIQQTTDGGYIIAGWTESYGMGGKDTYLIKTDVGGNLI